MPTYAERRKQQLHAEIIDAAFDVFAERGYHDAGVADIAARVGIGHSTFYRHFDSKREILDQVIDSVIERATAALAADNAPEAATNLADYRAQVERIVAALDDITSDLRVVRIVLIQAAGVDAELEQRVFGLFDLAVTLTASYLDHGRAHGYLRADLDGTATARSLVGMILGTAMLGLNPNLDRAARSQTMHEAVRMMFDGIAI
ncbi:TetR/AcrR family transcriptional regulator [Skermania sp. ID1734]|uniref:TetR/AcrR family transcriptional regulator n=1 Tax=Skermania sp. ID1734 TaxID=2597516 RepID=UPI00117CC2A0|nr:TetR/AcrR family transcriptional regulator [Skermania sp. ID1734]TSE01075.1 TetR/AcrR family transcriptional regulator [Skermania sp. ID1734]